MQSLVKLYHIETRPPSLGDNTGDLDRLKKVLSGYLQGQNPVVPFHRIAPVAEAFRQSGFKGYALVIHFPGGPQLVDFFAKLLRCCWAWRLISAQRILRRHW